MTAKTVSVDVKAAEDHLMKFLSVEGVTGQEKAIAAVVSNELKKVGVPASAIRFDDVNKRIPLPTQTGNLIVDLPRHTPGPAARCFPRTSTPYRYVPAQSRSAKGTGSSPTARPRSAATIAPAVPCW